MRPLIGTVVGSHPLAGSVLELVWLLPLLPLLGFLVNGLLALLLSPGRVPPIRTRDVRRMEGTTRTRPASVRGTPMPSPPAGDMATIIIRWCATAMLRS